MRRATHDMLAAQARERGVSLAALLAEIADERRREVWLVSLGAGTAAEPGKTGPAVAVSGDQLNASVPGELIVVVPLSSSRAPSELRIEIPPGVGLDRPSRTICRALRSVVSARLVRKTGNVDAETMDHIETALSLILELRPTPTG